MKTLFIAMLGVLVLAALATMHMNPELSSSVPVLYWVTDNNPARTLQIENFRKWLKKNGHPDVDLRVDSANADSSKKIIQGVSGVAGDAIDTWVPYGELIYFVETGIVEDVTDAALKLGFDPSKTYPAIKDDITIDGRQYVFPCNVGSIMLIVNKDTFKKFGVEPPPSRWGIEEFEKKGKEYIEAANKGQTRRDRFFCNSVDSLALARSFGGDFYNETLTKSAAHGRHFVEAFRLIHKWTYEDHILPTAAEVASFSTQSGYGGATYQLFNSGNFAMISSGLHALIQFRQFGSIDLDVVEAPNGGFPNTGIGARCAFVYKGGKHKELAELFLAYLASEEYNMNIVEDSDALPPNPIYTKTEAFLHPPKYPNEWSVHSKFADAVDISIVVSKSPYISNTLAYKFNSDGYLAAMSDVMSSEEAAKSIQERVDEEIARTLKENPKLQEAYAKDLEIQKRIEERLAKGEKIPLSWIKNPFHRKYYKEKGLAE